MKIYTRRGDRGETDLFGGPRVRKDHLRVETYGAVDELNSVLGLAAAQSGDDEIRAICRTVQETLFELGAYLASPPAEGRPRRETAKLAQADVDDLEARIDALERELPPLRRFVLPGGTPAAAALHMARAVCRRAERRAVSLEREEGLDPLALGYLNRLSDLLFTLARVEDRRAGAPEEQWPGRAR